MSKYRLIGSFDNKEATFSETDGQIEVCIPLQSKSGELLYGVGNTRSELRKYRVYPSEDGYDLLLLAAMVYLADTRISRSLHGQDNWTREISIELPVNNMEQWAGKEVLFEKMLGFLTGDIWDLKFVRRTVNVAFPVEDKKAGFEAVTLFSGGMDSLIASINHLENEQDVALVSHAGEGFTKNAQTKLLRVFQEQYPKLKPASLNLWMVFDKNIIPNGGIENTTRSRSFLFIAFGVFTVSGMKGVKTLSVPENALIALNVPLDDLRIGSHSTRTTHPYYIGLWNETLQELGLGCSIENPYWNKTKGEMADECLNKELLLSTMKISTSCSSPLKARWSKQPPQHCGYCVPCLIRRAAMHKTFGFLNDTTTYTEESIQALLENHASKKGEQLRSFQVAIKKLIDNPKLKELYIYKSGRLEGDDEYMAQLADVYYRGLMEVGSFIEAHLKHEKTYDASNQVGL